MIKFAVIGTSWITEEFIKGCNLLDGKMELLAVYSRTAEKGKLFAEKYGAKKVYTDLDEMGNDGEIDAVYIASPNAFHYSQSKKMLEYGKHVICEKPITVTPDELSCLQSLAESKNLIYIEALMAQHLPARNILIDAVKKIGKISHVRFDFSQRSSKLDSFLLGEHQNIFDPKMATGALMDLGVYCVYPCIDLFGKPENIYAYCNKLHTGIDGDGGAILKYKDFSAELTYSKLGDSRIGSEIIGENGTILIESISKQTNMKIIFKDGSEEILTGTNDKAWLMSFEANDFYNYVTAPTHFADDIKRVSSLALKVSQVMQEIRNIADIKFNY